MVALGALLLAPVAAVVGFYQAQQIEVGAALELEKNGHFRYQLDYGAVSEHAEGEWTFDGKAVRLTTKPKPTAPRFELVRDDPAPPGQIGLALEPPGFGDGYRLRAIGTDARSGEKGLVETDSEGRVEAGGRMLSAIEPLVPVYGVPAGSFALSPDRGHRLLLRFHANDLATAGFDNEPLALTSRGLVLNRYDSAIRFLRVRP
ncbi:MAG TPA: hypothetical protein VJT70_01355 [Sphingomicrobium sp.]|nr:hypothetical protein [Sphingomicrobium sp.]